MSIIAQADKKKPPNDSYPTYTFYKIVYVGALIVQDLVVDMQLLRVWLLIEV